MPQESESDTCPLSSREAFFLLDLKNVCILHDAVDIDRALKARLHSPVCVEEHVDVCFKLPALIARLVQFELRGEQHSTLHIVSE